METAMSVDGFQATVRQEPPAAMIDLSGEISGGSEARLNAAYDEAAGRYPRAIVLNFAEVGYINSTGIALIVGILARARKDGVPLFTCRLSDHYRQIFEITRLIDFVQVVPDEASAMASVIRLAQEVES
jgi:anti-anti-sigma factor